MTKNFVQIDTKTGIKEFELFQGDITNLPFQVDLLVVSAFKNDYTPTKSSIIGQLHKSGVDVNDLSKRPLIDFRNSLDIWISSKLKNKNFNQIVCVEIIGGKYIFESAIKNLFAAISALEIQGEKNTTIALPMLGAGDQDFDIHLVVSTLIDLSLDFLKFSRYLKKVYFIVYSDIKATVFNEEMNNILGRVKIKSPQGILADLLRNELNQKIDKLFIIREDLSIFMDLKRVINSNFRSFEFGAITRKSVEYIIDDLNPSTAKQFELIKKIDSLSQIGISQWIQSYFHLIRVFGNEAVHNKDKKERSPSNVDEKDLEIGMYCMIKLIDFYIDQKFTARNRS
jgi:hypothetical protein